MAKYLRTSGISSGIDELIREAKERVYIISPYLKLSDQIKELLQDKEREKVDVRLIFGKQELNPTEMSFLQSLKYVRLYFSKNLHAKCYLNEHRMIIASMNLYEFSQQNNKEMGILVDASVEGDKQVYDDAWKDIQSILQNAQDFAYAKVDKDAPPPSRQVEVKQSPPVVASGNGKYHSVTALSKEMNISSKELFARLEGLRWIARANDTWELTSLGKDKGGQMRKGQYGDFIAWPDSLIKEIV